MPRQPVRTLDDVIRERKKSWRFCFWWYVYWPQEMWWRLRINIRIVLGKMWRRLRRQESDCEDLSALLTVVDAAVAWREHMLSYHQANDNLNVATETMELTESYLQRAYDAMIAAIDEFRRVRDE